MSDFKLKKRVEALINRYLQPAGGRVFVISGPSGVGKTVLCKQAVLRDSHIRYSVSYTTRRKRPGEEDGREYHFVSEERFQKGIESNEFWEYASVHGNLYGTSRSASEKICGEGYDLLMDIDVQGAMQLKDLKLNAIYIFIFPPSIEMLQKRLKKRDDTTLEEIEMRMEEASREMDRSEEYDFIIVNQDLEKSVELFCNIISASHFRVDRNCNVLSI